MADSFIGCAHNECQAAITGCLKQGRNDMNKLFIPVIMAVLVAMNGCGQKEKEIGGIPEREQKIVSQKQETAPEAKHESKVLDGEVGSSSRWGSGWINLAAVTNFSAGDVLRLRIGGTANKVIVRLLPEGKSPDSSVGVVGGTIKVPENRIVDVTLDEDRRDIIQISVHGGPNPWDRFPLGGDNEGATLESAELVR